MMRRSGGYVTPVTSLSPQNESVNWLCGQNLIDTIQNLTLIIDNNSLHHSLESVMALANKY